MTSQDRTIGGRIRPSGGGGHEARAAVPVVRSGNALLRSCPSDLGVSGSQVRVARAAAQMTDKDKEIARMFCPACKSYTAVKDSLWGQYRCPCGWRSGS